MTHLSASDSFTIMALYKFTYLLIQHAEYCGGVPGIVMEFHIVWRVVTLHCASVTTMLKGVVRFTDVVKVEIIHFFLLS